MKIIEEQLLIEKVLTEGTDYKGKAVKKIVDSGLFDKDVSEKIINALHKEDIHAFNHAPAWTEKYLIGIANMLIKYCNGDSSKAQQFLTECPNVFESYITWVKENRPKMDTKQQTELDKKFNEQMSFEDVVKANEEHYNELDAKSKEELSKMDFSASSHFELIPIDSYEQFHKMFGGHWTGDGSSDKYAGGGGTAWCHTNNEPTYNRYVDNGKYQFFVLANKNWKNIPFNSESNRENPKDDYGNSLIALVINKRTGNLKYATLRCNHVGVSSNADNQYKTYAELSSIAGFNVEDKVKDYLKDTIIDNSDIDDAWKSFDGTRESLEYICDALDVDYRTLTHIEIPYGVESLGYGVFYNCKSLTNITIPDSVTSIDYFAFYECYSLTSVTIPNSVESIGDYVFDSCMSLTSVTIPNSVTRIGVGAFMDCDRLTSITIGNSVTSIGNWAFKSSPNVVIKTNNPYAIDYCKENSIKYESTSNESMTNTFKFKLLEKVLTEDIAGVKKQYPKIDDSTFDKALSSDPTYKDGSNNVGKYTKWILTLLNKNLIELADIPNGVATENGDTYWIKDLLTQFDEIKNSKDKELPSKDISYYKSLKQLSDAIENDVSEKELSSRQKERALRNSDEVEFIGSNSKWEMYTPLSYAGSCTLGKGTRWCTAYSEDDTYYRHYSNNGVLIVFINKQDSSEKYQLWIPEEGEGELQFLEADDVTDVDFYEFFEKNKDLYDAIENNIAGHIYLPVLYSPDELENYIYDGSPIDGIVRDRIKNIVISDGISYIEQDAFYDCINLESITIPDSVTEIGSYAFAYCKRLTNITIPNSVIYIDEGAFDGCNNLTSITIPGSVTEIGYKAFYYCQSLTSIIIPDSVTSIGAATFEGCTSLTSVMLGNSVTSIGDYAFAFCTSLTSITIPDSVTSINKRAFNGCTSLTSVTIPNSVTSIGDATFYGCDKNKLKFYVEKNSYAMEYAQINGFDYDYINSANESYNHFKFKRLK